MTTLRAMKTYYLKFWARATGETSNPLIAALDIQRVYVTADDGSCGGYIELRVAHKERVRGDYYDEHRIAKGDSVRETDRSVCLKLEGEIESAIRAAIGGDLTEEMLFSEMKKRSRGVNWACGADQKKQLRKLSQFTFEA